MNYKVIIWLLAWILKIEGFLMLMPCIISIIYREKLGIIYLLLALMAITAGRLVSRK